MSIEIFNNASANGSLIASATSVLAGKLGMQAFETPVAGPLGVAALPPKQELQIQRFVEHPPARRISDPTFQHVLGEHFGKGTRFEGNSPVVMTGHLIDLIRGRIETMRALPCGEGDKARFCREYLLHTGQDLDGLFDQVATGLEKGARLRRAFEGSPKAFYDEMKAAVEALGPGESIYFQGGWTEKGLEGGHAIVYEFIREETGNYAFRVYNRGDGAGKYHTKGIHDRQEKNLPFTEIVGVEKRRLLSPAFLQALQELGKEPPYGKESWQSSELYQGVLPLLKGKMSHRVYSPHQMLVSPPVGHCTFLSWAGLLHQHMGKTGNFERLEYEIQFKTLYDYFHQNQSRLNDERVRKLIQKGLLSFARKTEALFKLSALTQEEVDFTERKIAEIRECVSQAEEEDQRLILKNTPSFDRALRQSATEEFSAVSLPPSRPLKPYLPTTYTAIETIQVPPYSAQTFLSDLKTTVAKIHTANEKGKHINAVRAAQEWIKAIPLREPFCRFLSREEAEIAMEGLTALGREYYLSFLRDPQMVSKLRTVDYLAQIKLLAIGDALARSALGFGFPSLYQQHFDLILEAASSDVTLYDPSWAQQIDSIKEYFEAIDPKEKRSRRNHISFFGLENKPAYPSYNGGWVSNPDLACLKFKERVFLRERRDIKNEDCLIEYEDLNWVKDFLQRPETAEKIRSSFPQIALEDPIAKAVFFSYPDTDSPDALSRKTVLPPSFFAIRELSLLSDLLLQVRNVQGRILGNSRHAVPTTEGDVSKGIVLKSAFHKKDDGISTDFWVEKRFPFGLSFLELDSPETLSSGSYYQKPLLDLYAFLRGGDDLSLGPKEGEGYCHLRKKWLNPLGDDLKRLYGMAIQKSQYGLRRRVASHDKMLLVPESIAADPMSWRGREKAGSLPLISTHLQEMRELLSLSSFPELQVQETFGYFNKRKGLLQKVPYQKFFTKLMFEPGLLMQELKRQPPKSGRFSNLIAQFCKDEYEFYTELGDIPTALYFLDLDRLFAAHVREALASFPGAFPDRYRSPFLNSGKEYDRILSSPTLSDHNRVLVQLERALGYKSSSRLDADDAEHLLSAAIWIHSLPQGAYEQETTTWIDEQGGEWESSDQAYQNGVTQLFGHRNPPSEIPGKIREVDSLLARFQPEMYALFEKEGDPILNRIVRSIRPHHSDLAWKADPFPTFVSADGLIAVNVVEGTLSEKGGTLRQIPVSLREHPDVVPFYENQEILLGSEIERDVWEFTNRKGEQYRAETGDRFALYREIDGAWHKKIQEPFPLPKPILETSHFWQKEDDRIRVSDRNNRQVAEIQIEKGKGIVYRLEEGKRTDLVLENLQKPHAYKALERIESSEEILVWKKRGEEGPSWIELPRLGLHFKIQSRDGEKRAFSQEIRGFWIAKEQAVFPLKGIGQSLVLEGAMGKRIVLIPNGNLPHVGNGSLDTRYQIGLSTKASQKFFRYEWEGEKLIPANQGARIHLALMRLSEHDYDEAHKELQFFASHLRPYSHEEWEQLKTIASYASTNSDHDPRSAAIRVYALFLMLRDGIDSDRADLTELGNSHIFAVQREYVRKIDEIPPRLRVSPEEGQLVFDLLSEIYAQIGKKTFPPPLDVSVSTVQDAVSVQPIPGIKEIGEKVAALIKNGYAFLHAIGSPESPSASLRTGKISQNFLSLYDALRQPVSEESAAGFLQMMSGEPLPDLLSLEEMGHEIESRLALALSGEGSDEEKAFALVLDEVRRSPQDFPESSLVRDQFSQFRAAKNGRDGFDAMRTVSKWFETHLLKKIKWPGHAIDSSQRVAQEIPWPLAEFQPPSSQTAPLLSSTRLPSVLWQKAPVPNLGEYIETLPASPEKRNRLIEVGEELQTLFAADPGDHVARQKFKQARADLQQFAAESPIAPEYRIAPNADWDCLETTLRSEVAHLSSALARQEEEMLKLANRMPDKEDAATSRSLSTASEDWKPLEMGDLLFRFSTPDDERMRQANPALSEAEIRKLYGQIAVYLVQATHKQHLVRCLKGVQEIRKTALNPAENQLAVEAFAQTALAQRGYDLAKSPEYLVFEYANDLLLRKSQAESLDRLQLRAPSPHSRHDLGAALEMIMGSGKTAVLSPLIAYLEADGSEIPFVVMPDALLPSMAEQLRDKLGPSFDRLIEVIGIKRNTLLDARKLSRILKKLESAKDHRKVIVMTSSSLQSFFLKFVEAMLSGSSPREISLFRKIFHELRTAGQVTIDEMDLILDILKSHHFTHGAHAPLKQETIDAVSDLYLLLAEHGELSTLLNVGFLPSKTGKPFTAAYYQEAIREPLIEEIAKGDFSQSNPSLRKFLHNLSSKEREWVNAYLSERKDAAAFRFVDSIPSMQIKNSLAVLKEEASKLLPLTMKKQVDEHYGFIPQGASTEQSQRLAIPYHGSHNPALSAQFGTELEVLNYTIQQYLAKGIPMEILDDELNRLRESALDYLHKNPNRKIENSPAYAAFRRLSEPYVFSLLGLTEREKQTLLEHVSKTPALAIGLVRSHALAEIKTFPKQLNTNAQIFSMLFKRLKGFTGTMWNADTFPHAFARFFLSDTDVKTLHILWEKRSPAPPVSIAHRLSSLEDAAAALAQIYGESGTGSFADAGGMFRSFENRDVAKALLDLHMKNGYRGVIFYDENNNLMVWERGKNAPVPRSESDLSNNQLIAYWDQKHTTGSDLKLSPEMHAFVTVSRHTLMRDILQTVWRLRQLDKGQRVSFALLDEEREVIATTLHRLTGRNPDEPLHLGDLLLYALYNQSVRQGSDNFRALKQKLQNVVIDPVLEILSDPAVSDREAFELFDQIQTLFVSSASENPYESIGCPTSTDANGVIVREMVEKLLGSKPFLAFKTHPFLRTRFDASEMEKRIRKIAVEELKRLPEKLERVEQYETEIELETETQKEKEVEKEKEKEKETEKENEIDLSSFRKDYKPYPVFAWNGERLFERQTLHPTSVPKFFGLKTQSLSAKGLKGLGLSPLFSIHDALASHSSTLKSAPSFDPNLLGSLNFRPVYQGKEDSLLKRAFDFAASVVREEGQTPPYSPFGLFQDSSQHLLVIQDPDTKQIQAAMIDQEDARALSALLEKDQKSPLPGKRETRLCLYHLENGVYRQGKEPVEGLEKDPLFLRLKTQAKFFNGELAYSEEEIGVLKGWIKESGADEMYHLFNDQILSWKQTSKRVLPHTDIGEIFREQGVFSTVGA